ncbi:MAG: beta-ketoacyl synthase N-terminal-like domain-containing protein [Microcystis panniformis]
MSKIAIIGIGCLFPEAKNLEELWEILIQGRDVTSEIKAEELRGNDPAFYYDGNLGTPDKISYTKQGYLRGFNFDPRGYRLPPEELQQFDRLHHLCFYGAKEALKDSGYEDEEAILSQTGLILGNLCIPTEYSSLIFSDIHLQSLSFYLRKLLDLPEFTFKSLTESLTIAPENALASSSPVHIVCRGLGLGKIRYAIDAACASSLYVMELASYYLNTGQAKMMLAGAVCCPERLQVLHGFNVLHAFPSQGRSTPLDQSSEGLKFGEGAGIFALKRLCDAEKDGDRIYAVIESVGLANDGAGKHILSPSQKGQYLALERAYGDSPLADYIECHATGTPLGDRTELNTLEKFFQAKQSVSQIGANKAHLGHLLTASGMVSLIKSIWAIKQGIIPPTIGIDQAITSENGVISSENIVQSPTPWKKNHQPKRIGINAFGFGGTNAHLILREHSPTSTPATSNFTPLPTDSLAIIGMNLHIGTVEGLEAFSHALYSQANLQQPLPPQRWLGVEKTLTRLPNPGVYLEKFDLDCLRYKIPPNQVSSLLFDHLFMLKIADLALQDAGFQKGDPHLSDTAVIIAMEMNLAAHRSITRLNLPLYLRETLSQFNITLTEEQIQSLESLLKDCISPSFSLEGITGGIGNLAASRIASLWDFTGPAFTLSDGESSFPKALEVAKFLLAWGKVKAVVIGAIDQSAGWEQVQWREMNGDIPPTTFFGEGAAAIVLMKTNEAEGSGRKIYATIEGLSIVQTNDRTISPVLTCEVAEKALAQAGISSQAVGYLEVSNPTVDEQVTSLGQLYGLESGLIGSVRSSIGETLVLSGLASLIKISLYLHHRRLPDVQPGLERTWQLKDEAEKRFAALHGMSHDGTYSHLILREGNPPVPLDKLSERSADFNERRLIKTLYSGSLNMTDMLLNDENLQKFIWHNEEKIHENNLSSIKTRQGRNYLPLLTSEQAIFENQLAVNAELENIFLQIQSSFYQSLNHDLPSCVDGQTIDELGGKKKNYEESSSKSLTYPLVWNLEEILTLATGNVSNILGNYYQEMDTYPIRTRTPLPPFMFVSRVTKMTAVRGELQPCYIEWEYDIPKDSFFAAHGIITGIIPFEATHALLLPLAYIGCDLMFKGQLRYRALDSEVEFLGELPGAGVTIRGEIFINKFIKTHKNLLLQYTYNCYYDEKQILKITANSGYFSEADLQKHKGLAEFKVSPKEIIKLKPFRPILNCERTAFNKADIEALQAGNFAKCFGADYALSTFKDQFLSSHSLLMLDRILHLDREGGFWKLGQILGEVDIDPEHWVFQAHFKNDPVMPGTMLVEGCNQVALFYMYYLGLHTKFSEFIPTWLSQSHKSKAKFRGEVKPYHHRVQFRITVKEINDKDDPFIITVAEIILKETIIGICDNLAVKLRKH